MRVQIQKYGESSSGGKVNDYYFLQVSLMSNKHDYYILLSSLDQGYCAISDESDELSKEGWRIP